MKNMSEPGTVDFEPASPPSGRPVMANTAVLAAYTVVEMFVVFLFTIALARYLGAEEFGRLGFALSFALLTSILSDPGVSIAVMKLVARSPTEGQIT
jgi:O-antigen/teichoic acid export membrane protein